MAKLVVFFQGTSVANLSLANGIVRSSFPPPTEAEVEFGIFDRWRYEWLGLGVPEAMAMAERVKSLLKMVPRLGASVALAPSEIGEDRPVLLTLRAQIAESRRREVAEFFDGSGGVGAHLISSYHEIVGDWFVWHFRAENHGLARGAFSALLSLAGDFYVEAFQAAEITLKAGFDVLAYAMQRAA